MVRVSPALSEFPHQAVAKALNMKASSILPLFSLLAGALVSALELPAGVPRDVLEFRSKHPYKAPTQHHRRKVTIRSSKNDEDDVSDAFLKGLKKANHGGTLYLPEGHTYMIGKPLDLTWLNDVHIHLEGEIKFTNDTAYWQEHAFAHPFQVSDSLLQPPILVANESTELSHVLEVGRQGHQDLRRRCPERKRPAMVERVLRTRDPRP